MKFLFARPLAAAALVAGVAASAHAQSTTAVAQPSNTIELGVDAQAAVGLGDDSYVNIGFPGSRGRVGFFLNRESRVSVEPAIGFLYSDSEGGDGALAYDLELGALYHFRPPLQVADVAAANRVSVTYVRPFINVSGITGDGGDSRVSLGGGLGVKIPFRTNIAFRAEANLGYDLDNEAARLGALLGLSFFTRRGQ